MKDLIKLLQLRAYIFTCSYETAWNQWLTKEEKQNYSYKEVMNSR